MKRILVSILCLIFCLGPAFAQDKVLDSLHFRLHNALDDTARVKLMNAIGERYQFIRQDSAIYYFTHAIELSERISYPYGSFIGYSKLAFLLNTTSNYSKSLEMAVKSLKIAEQLKNNRDFAIAESYHIMGIVNRRMGNDSIGMIHCRQSLEAYERAGARNGKMNFGTPMNMALIYLKWKKPDSALLYARETYEVGLVSTNTAPAAASAAASTLAHVYEETGNIQMAHQYHLVGLNFTNKYPGAKLLKSRFFNNYARYFQKIGNYDSCVYYAKNSLQLGQNNKFGEHTSDAAAILTEVYELQHRPDSSLKYLKVLAALKDSIFSQSKLEQVMLLNFEEGQRQKDLDIARERYQNQVRLYALIAAAGIFLFVSIVLYRNNQHKQRANTKLESQKDEIDRQRSKAECALQDLKSAQAQLVQSEKMASLGELTAGIAHEIQNPLNFVNNFSEINSELLGELEFEIEKNNFGAMKNIVADLRENEEKIAHHGKRADSIVKGMLQHSRTGSGQLELTDLNALADEYLRLSYHGMRARDKAFNAVLLTDFDKKIEKIAIIRQDFSRVFLNLYNNAFYAVLQKQKNGIQINESEGKCYEPTILVATKKLGDHIEIRVKDNGNGISERIKDKIFQPFFTTKDAGQGTGLGLSLVYDIITKEHGGQIKVETNENHYTEFIIQIPLKEHF